MTAFKLSTILPCTSFFGEGRLLMGLLVLLMQATVILWPIAARWAHRSEERSGVEKLLAELSDAYRVPVDPYARPTKKFRQLA